MPIKQFGSISIVTGRRGFRPRPGRSNFVRQSANLWQYKQLIQGQLAAQLGAFADDVHLIDGLPMRLCCITDAPRCQRFQDIASYGYCAAKDEYFYGFRGHLNISLNGVITGFIVTPANGDERAALWEISQGRPPESVHLEQRLRWLIETVNSQLSERFHFERICCRDLWHLTSRVNRKILAHTLGL